MGTQYIPRAEWDDFLSAFSADNQTRSVAVEIESAELGTQRLVDARPLLAVEPDLEDEREATITIVAGDPEGGGPAALTHQVMNPQAIWVKEGGEGQAEALDIETEGGRTIIQFV